MLLSFTSTSDSVVPTEAVAEVIDGCKKQLGSEKAQAGLVFTSYMEANYTEMLTMIMEAFPGIKLVGCTTDSEMSSTMGFTEDSITLTLFSSDIIEFAATVATDISKNTNGAFQKAATTCRAQLTQAPACGLIFPDGLSTIGIPLDEVVKASFGESFPFFGGTAGDHYLLKKTFQFFGTEVYSDAAPILLFAGNLALSYRIVSGWTAIGNYFTIDNFEDNKIYTIGGQSAQAFYESYLGPYQQAFTDFPLAVYQEEEKEFVLRTPLDVNKEDGSMVFIGNFFKGAKVRLTTVLRDDAINAADNANKELLEEIDGEADVILNFSCAVRRHFLGSRTAEECKRLKENSTISFTGFYGYGEIGPHGVNGPTKFHTNTYLILAMKVR